MIAQTKLASLTMATGDPTEAAVIGEAALQSAGPIRSRRAADDLRELSRYASRHLRIDTVAALRHHISVAVAAS